MKRLFSLLLVLVMLFSCVSFAHADLATVTDLEPTEAAAAVIRTEAEEAAFEAGYVLLKQGTLLYASAALNGHAGKLAADAIVWAFDADDDAVHVAYAVDGCVMTAWVRQSAVSPAHEPAEGNASYAGHALSNIHLVTEEEAPVEDETPAETEELVEAETPAETEELVEAETPAEPEEPVEAETPAETEELVEVETPAEPEKPVEAETPAEPEEPADAEKPAETKRPEQAAEATPTDLEEPLATATDLDESRAVNLTGALSSTLSWELRGTELLIYGTGAVPSYNKAGLAPWAGSAASIRSVTLETGVTEVGSYAFANCPNLTAVSMDYGIARIGGNAFTGSPVSVIRYDGTARDWSSLQSASASGNSAFFAVTPVVSLIDRGSCGDDVQYQLRTDYSLVISGCGAMTSYSSSGAPWYAWRDQIVSVTFAGSSITIGNYALAYCTSLREVNFNDAVTSIGSYAFRTCTSLSAITLPDTLKDIGTSAFRGCSSLLDVVIPYGLETLNGYVFTDCTSLRTVTLPVSLKSVSVSSPFGNCTSLQEIRYTGSSAQWNAVTVKCTLPMQPTFGAMTGSCGSGVYYVLTENAPDDYTLAIYGKGCMEDYAAPSDAPWHTRRASITKVSVANGVTSVGRYAFSGMARLKSALLPVSLTEIGELAFSGDAALLLNDLPVGLTKIGKNAFSGCKQLTYVYIPDGVTVLNENTFSDCSSLMHVVLNSRLTAIGAGCFSGTNITLTYFNGTAEQWDAITVGRYNEALTGSEIWIDGDITDSGSCGYSMNWRLLSDGTLVISGSGDMANYASGGAPWYGLRTGVKAVKISEGVRSIGSYAFEGCSELTDVTVPASIELIGASAFVGCIHVTNVAYSGSSSDWGSIISGKGNDNLLKASNVVFDLEMPVLKAPANVMARVVTNGTSVRITWDAMPGVSLFRVNAYTYDPATRLLTPKFSRWVNNTNYNDSQVAEGGYYVYSVAGATAKDKCGPESAFTAAKIEPNDASLKAAMKSVVQKGKTYAVSWIKPVDAKPSGYVVMRRKIATGEEVMLKEQTSLSFTDKTFEYGRRYSYSVLAYYNISVKVGSSTKTVRAYAYGCDWTPAPIVSPDVKVTPCGSDSVLLSWTPIDDVDTYGISVYLNNSDDYAESTWVNDRMTDDRFLIEDRMADHVVIRGFEKGKNYSIIMETNVGDLTMKSQRLKIKFSFTKLAAPALTVKRTACDRVTLSWNAVVGADWFDIYCKEGKDAEVLMATVPSSQLTWEMTVKPGTAYSWYVVARRTTDEQAASNFTSKSPKKSLTPAVLKTPAAPTTDVKSKYGTVIVTWKPIEFATSYVLYYKRSTDTEYQTFAARDGITTFPLNGAKTGESWLFHVVAVYDDPATGAHFESAVPKDKKLTISWKLPTAARPTLKAEGRIVTVRCKTVANANEYRIYFRPTGSTEDEKCLVVFPENIENGYITKNYTCLQAGVSYTVRVEASNTVTGDQIKPVSSTITIK